jgi:hypothetical protein
VPCLGNSVCGFLQANSKGVSSFPYCNCTNTIGGEECPLNWDTYDGKSITQSVSDQYKVRNPFNFLLTVLRSFVSCDPQTANEHDSLMRPRRVALKS